MDIKEVWDKGSKKQKTRLARAMGYRGEWSAIKYDDLPKRSGGMLQRDLVRLWKRKQSQK